MNISPPRPCRSDDRTRRLLTRSASIASAGLASLSLRRGALLLAAVSPQRRQPEAVAELPSVTVIVPAHNEDAVIEHTLAAVEAFDYPLDCLSVVLVDDRSTDSTVRHLRRWTARSLRWHTLELSDQVGKWEAINRAMLACPPSELVFICDADLRPRADCLLRLVAAFEDKSVGAAAAFLSPRNAAGSLVARYSAVETWVHQLVTSAGKDRLDLCPPALGASVFRRSALEEVGGFPAGLPGGDVRITVALTRQGWRTRFVPAAVVDNTVAAGWIDYWHQHTRWGRNVLGAADTHGVAGQRSGLARGLEIAVSSTGYFDRVLLAGALAMRVFGAMTLRPPAVYVAIRAFEIAVALARARVSQPWRYLLVVPIFFVVDALASVAAVVGHVTMRPRRWRRPPRRSTSSRRHAG